MTFPLPEVPVPGRLPRVDSSLTPLYSWDIRAGRYASRVTGRYIAFSAIRDALESVIASSSNNMVLASHQLTNSSISLSTWERTMMAEIKALHIASAASAKGGWAQMTNSDWLFVKDQIKAQYVYLQNFASEIYSGKQKLGGAFMFRTRLYGQAGRGTFEDVRRREAVAREFDQEKRILGVADHCAGCLQQAFLKWQPAGVLHSIGSEECATNCHCYFVFRNSATGEELSFHQEV